MFFATCVYGISFIILGNSAANCIAFGQAVLDAAAVSPSPGKVIGVAFAVNTFCCLLHSISRRWGILLNNFLGTVKLAMLFFFIIIGFIWMKSDVANANLDSRTAFSRKSSQNGPFLYAEALLFVMFPYSGFHQINYASCCNQPPFLTTTNLSVGFSRNR
jgi:amino acid transporter